jgi:hypothetical protein
MRFAVDEQQVVDDQLRRRLEALESPGAAEHLAGDLALRDVMLTVAGLLVAIVAMVWWAY